MEQTTFNLMAFNYHVGREMRTGYSFRTQGLPGMRPAGRVLAPPGSQIRQDKGPPKLLVPKPGRDGEWNVYEADTVAELASKREQGFALEPWIGEPS